MLRSTALLLSCFLAASLTHAQANAPASDVLVFTNGDQLTGHVESASGGSVVFKSDMAGELTIPFSKVKELRSGGNFAVLKKGPPSRANLVGEGDVHVAEGTVTVAPATQPPLTLATNNLGYLVDAPTYDKQVAGHVRFTEGWTGSALGGATIVRATDSITSFTAGIAIAQIVPSVAYLPRRTRTTFNLIETYGKSTSPVIPRNPNIPDSITRTNIFHADAERDWYFSPTLYALVDTAFDHNYAQGLVLQQIYGGGIGWTAIQTAHEQLDLKAEIHYEKQHFQTGTNPNIIGTIFGETYVRDLPHKVVFTEAGAYIPAWNHPSAYSAMITGALVIPTYKRLSTSISATDNFLNNPSPGYNQNSFQFVAGISYALH